jgi:hypothetical protein
MKKAIVDVFKSHSSPKLEMKKSVIFTADRPDSNDQPIYWVPIPDVKVLK